jgi:hypothetical protein
MLASCNQVSRSLTGTFNELRLLKQMLASCNQVSHSLTGMLAVCINELWLLKQMLTYINQCSCLLTVFFNELRLLKQMLASCNHNSYLLTGMLAVCINELWLLPGMFASFSQISQSLTGTSILLLSSFFKKLKRHRTIYFHNDVIAFDTFIRITKIGLNLGINLIPQFCIPFGMFISVLLIEEKLRMTAHLKRIFQSREERRRAGHFSPRGELSVIVVRVHGLAVAEPDGANHLAMMSHIRNQMPAPLLGRLITVRLRLVACGPLPLAHPTNATTRGHGTHCRLVSLGDEN